MKYLITIYFLLIVWVGKGQEILVNVDVGDAIPPTVLTGIQNHPTGTLDLVKASQEKLIILDFWATWCGACLAGMPKLDTLMREFNKELEVILVTKEVQGYVGQVFRKRRELEAYIPQLPIYYGDTVLNRLFLHNTIPTYVWLKNGKVIGITEEVTKKAVELAIEGREIGLRMKVEKSYEKLDKTKETLLQFLYKHSAPSSEVFRTYSFWTGYIDRLGPTGGFWHQLSMEGEVVRFTGTNFAIENLYRTAFGRASTYINDAAVEITSKSPYFVSRDLSGMEYEDWLVKYGLNYEVVVEPGRDIFEKMQSDVIQAFPEIHARIVPTLDTCLVLEIFNNNPDKNWRVEDGGFAQVDVNGSQTLEAEMISLMIKFEHMIFYRSKYPIVDSTGYLGKVNLVLNGRLQSVSDVNRELEPYGLRVTKKTATYQKLLLEDSRM